MTKKEVFKFKLDFFSNILNEFKTGKFNSIYWFKPADDILYEFFKNRTPDLNYTHSKVLVLGRTYITNIDMKAESGLIAKQIQGISNGFPQLPFTMTSTDFSETVNIYELHSIFCDAIKAVTGTNEEVFVSKWLHFHYPTAFPILDSKAEGVLNLHEGIFENNSVFLEEYENFHPYLNANQYKKRYCWFCFRLLKIRFFRHLYGYPPYVVLVGFPDDLRS